MAPVVPSRLRAGAMELTDIRGRGFLALILFRNLGQTDVGVLVEIYLIIGGED